MAENAELAELLGTRARRWFLEDPEIWQEFQSKRELEQWLLNRLKEDEGTMRAAMRHLKQAILSAADADELWELVLDQEEDQS